MTDRYTHSECGQCGWIGKITDLKDHPERPTAMDLGFCPDCMKNHRIIEVEVLMTEQEALDEIASYQ